MGLFFLYKTTTSDPGCLPMGWDSYSKRDGGTPELRDKMSPATDGSKHHLLGDRVALEHVMCCAGGEQEGCPARAVPWHAWDPVCRL
jgi:hypothetical protein